MEFTYVIQYSIFHIFLMIGRAYVSIQPGIDDQKRVDVAVFYLSNDVLVVDQTTNNQNMESSTRNRIRKWYGMHVE